MHPVSDLLARGRAFARNHRPWLVYAVALLLILAGAAIMRYSLPRPPFFDGDSWSYLRPGFRKLTGGMFQHANGRNFLYPTFLFAVLCLAGDFNAVPVCQHALGLLTGVVLALAWNALCALLTDVSERARWMARYAGLLLVADYLLSRSPILFEHTLRPEAVVPLFLAASFLLNLRALHAGYVERRPGLERWCLGSNFIAAAIAQSLKPSVGFAVAAANLPLLVWLCREGAPRREKAWTLAAAVAVCAVALWLPERILARHDLRAATFLPTTLFSIHAPAMHAQIVDDLRTGDTAPYPAAWLADVNRALERTLADAALPEHGPWTLIGFNADYILFGDPVFSPAFGTPPDRPKTAAFCWHYYRKAWRHRPGAMLAKIGTQLAFVYHPRSVSWLAAHLRNIDDPYTGRVQRPLSYDYQRALTSATTKQGMSAELDASIYGREYLQRLRVLRETEMVCWQFTGVAYFDSLLEFLHVPLLLLALAAGGALLAWKRAGPGPRVVVAAVWLCIAVNFAMFLTVAVVHTVEIDRYREIQRLMTAFTEFASLLLAGQAVACFLKKGTPLFKIIER